MPATASENDAEDVNDFLRRIQELGVKRDQEDEERTRKLEEEILQGRKERQARRAERARSISPSKYSPVNTPPPHKAGAVNSITLSAKHRLSPAPDLQPSNNVSSRDFVVDNAMDRPSGERSPLKENALLFTGDNRDRGDTGLTQQSATRMSPSSTLQLSKSSTLSWQQRPSSRASDKPRSRPLSMIATENAARSPRSTPEPPISNEESTLMSRDQISQSLASKDPAWFRQTSDRGGISAAYRKNQVEDAEVTETPSTSLRMQLPGMARDPIKQNASVDRQVSNIDRSSTSSRNSSSNDSMATTSFSRTSLVSESISSTVPLKSAQQLQPPGSVFSSEGEVESAGTGRAPAMSPSQGRMSPEKFDRSRSPSPTKGMGGFVQSAMMKRSDSVSKRWSVQSPPGLSRGDSVASNRSSHDHTTGMGWGGNPNSSTREMRSSGLSRESSPLLSSTPTSNHNTSTIMQESERPGTSGSLKSSMTASTDDVLFTKPNLPVPRSQGSLSSSRDMETVAHQDDNELRIIATPPASPSKTNDTRRWSPTKASWLESALNKPESPKAKPTPPPQQPIWLSELNKVKQRGSTDTAQTTPTQKHEVNIGGLLRSPPMGGPVKPLSIGGLSAGFSSRSTQNVQSSSEMPPQSSPNTNSRPTNVATSSARTPVIQDSINPSANTAEETMSKLPEIPFSGKGVKSSASGKIKPETPPKKDFKLNPKSRQQSSETDTADEPEFKNVFGQLRRTKTQNYVAPDELKDNILRGKAGLNITSGPQKTERKDEFMEAILKKKEDFKKAQIDGTGVTRPAPGSSSREVSIPEALARKANLSRPGTARATNLPSKDELRSGPNETTVYNRVARDLPKPKLAQESSAPGRLQSNESPGENPANKFKPGLAGILVRGPPGPGTANSAFSSFGSSITNTSKVASGNEVHSQDLGPQLTHMTKGRARGPRRKAPSTIATKVPAIETFDKTEAPRSSKSSSKTLDRQTETATSLERKTPVSNVSVQDEPENANPQTSSPRKLDIARRSKFLEEVSNKNEKTMQQLDTPKPSSPTKKANIPEVPMKISAPESSTTSHKLSLPEKSRPTPMPKSPKLTQKQDPARRISPQGNGGSQFLPKTKPNPLPKEEPSTERNIFPSQQPEDVKLRPQVDVVPAVKGTSAMFGGTSSIIRETQKLGSPIKLLTKTDEEVAPAVGGVSARSPVYKAKPARLESNQSPPETIQNISEPKIKPIPLPPPKPSTPTPLSSSSKPSSRQQTATTSATQGSDASEVLKDFFSPIGTVDAYHVDTAAILSAKSNPRLKIKSLQSQLFQFSSDGKKRAVPSHQERTLFEQNMYICIHTFTNAVGKKVTEVYFWVGDDVPESISQDAVIFAQSEAKSASGRLVKFQQGKEPGEFIEALGGIIVIRRGSSSKHDTLAPYILCGRRHAGQMVFDEVDFAPTSLCSGFPFLVAADSRKAYLWRGKGSDSDELSCARLIGADSGLTGEIDEIEDGTEPASFLSVFGEKKQIMKSAEHWKLKPKYPQYRSRLFCSESVSNKILEIHPFVQSDISPSGIYVLDTFFELYIIVGARSQSRYASFCTAVQFAQEYGILAAGIEDRPFVPISTVLLEGVPRDLKFVFRKWKDAVMTTTVKAPAKQGLARSKSLRILPLTAALDAIRP